MNATNIFLQLFFNGWNENQCLFHFFECNDTRRKRDFKLLYENRFRALSPRFKKYYENCIQNISKLFEKRIVSRINPLHSDYNY